MKKLGIAKNQGQTRKKEFSKCGVFFGDATSEITLFIRGIRRCIFRFRTYMIGVMTVINNNCGW